jgi:CRP/FNR family cyclic AMP-dependent transcriptional regulator
VPSLLEAIGDDDRSALLKAAVRRRFGRGEIVFHEGDPGESLHVVTKGVFVARSSSTHGHVLAVNVFRPGTVFGELSLLGSRPIRNATVASLERGETLMVHRRDFEDLRVRSPRVDRFLISVLAERNQILTAQVIELLFAPVDVRVCRQLLLFAEISTSGSTDAWISISQADLAALAGTTRATVNRALRAVERDGLVALARGRIRIVDANGLRQRAR